MDLIIRRAYQRVPERRAGAPFGALRLDLTGRLRDCADQTLPNAAGVSALLSSALNTLAAPSLTLQLMRGMRDRGASLVGATLIVSAGGEWRTARVQESDHDFTEVRQFCVSRV